VFYTWQDKYKGTTFVLLLPPVSKLRAPSQRQRRRNQTKTAMAKTTKNADDNREDAWRDREMRGGRWQDPRDPDQQKTAAFTQMSCKMRVGEAQDFKAICADIGIPPNRAMRIMARKVSGFLEVDAPALRELRAITRQITGIATNINQIARVANQTGQADLKWLADERKKLGAEMARLETKVQAILNVAQRRMDGARSLRDVAADG